MTRTMILLPDETHKLLKHLAIEREISLSQMIRDAVESMIQEDLEDVKRAETVLKSFVPGTGISFDAYLAERRSKKSSK